MIVIRLTVSVVLVWSEYVAADRTDAPLQFWLWKPEEERLGGKGSAEVQSTSSKIFKVSHQISFPFYNL